MFITTLPTSVPAGTSSGFVISISTIISDFSITDAYWSDVLNIASVTLRYEDATGTEHHSMLFPTDAPTAFLLTSIAAIQNTWQLQLVTLSDQDGGNYTVTRSQFPSPTAYDVPVVAPLGPPPSPLLYLLSTAGITSSDDTVSGWTDQVASVNFTVPDNAADCGATFVSDAINGLPGISFAFTDGTLPGSALSASVDILQGSTDFTGFIVMYIDANQTGSSNIFSWGRDNSGGVWLENTNSGGGFGSFNFSVEYASGSVTSCNVAPPSDQWLILFLQKSGTTLAAGYNNNTPTTATAPTVNIYTPGGPDELFYLGSSGLANGVRNIIGVFGEVQFFNSALTSDQITVVMTTLAAKYEIAI